MTTVEDRLREAGASLEPVELELPAFRSLRRRVRRRRLVAATGVVALVACAAIGVTAANARNRVEVAHAGPTTSVSTSTVRSTTAPSAVATVLDPAVRAAITSRLGSYIAGRVTDDSRAGKSSAANVWGEPVISEASAPVEVDGSVLAVAAFSFDPTGRPVQILEYENERWSPVMALAAPTSPGTIDHPGALDLISEGAPIVITHVTGTTRPDFLIEFAGGGCVNAAMVSTAGAQDQWRYVPFSGPFPTGELLGGNPMVIDGALTTTNDCAATVSLSERRSWTWAYDAASAAMIGHVHPGWPARPTDAGGSGG